VNLFFCFFLLPKPYTPTKPQAGNPKLETKPYTQNTGLYRGAAAAEEREQEQKKKTGLYRGAAAVEEKARGS
jgi:hypothetical protein